MCHMQHYDFLTPLVSCTIISRFAHIMHNMPGNSNRVSDLYAQVNLPKQIEYIVAL